MEAQERTRGTMREIKVGDDVIIKDVRNVLGNNDKTSDSVEEYMAKVVSVTHGVGSDEGIVVNGNRITPVYEEKDTQEDIMHDKHYRETVVEPILVMQALFSHDEFIGFLKGNILKYRLRAGHKGGEKGMKDDLDKIHVYEEWLERAKKGERILL